MHVLYTVVAVLVAYYVGYAVAARRAATYRNALLRACDMLGSECPGAGPDRDREVCVRCAQTGAHDDNAAGCWAQNLLRTTR